MPGSVRWLHPVLCLGPDRDGQRDGFRRPPEWPDAENVICITGVTRRSDYVFSANAEQPFTIGDEGGSSSSGDGQLGKNVFDVRGDRSHTRRQCLRDSGVRSPRPQRGKNIQLTPGQAVWKWLLTPTHDCATCRTAEGKQLDRQRLQP